LGRFAAVILLVAALLATVPQAGAAPPLRVLYAGSMVALMEHDLGPAFTKATGTVVDGRAGGSVALAHMILDGLQIPDVFISADPGVNRLLLHRGSGPSAPWFFTLARTTMVVAYSPQSRFAAALREAAAGRRLWYAVLATPGLRLGRTDPRLDPKGYRTVLTLKLAERYYHRPGLEARLLGAPENPAQTFPEEALVGRLDSGQLDAGFFYLAEVTDQHLPYIALPDAINLGDPAMARAYAQVAYTDAAGHMFRGAPILYTVTIPSTARSEAAAVEFVRFLLAPEGRRILGAHGLLSVPVLAGGDPRTVPPALRPLIRGTYEG
jgi:molybdate/tungstate transport system substrate-binding protein